MIRRFYDHPGHPLHGKRLTKRESGLVMVLCACGVEHPTPESVEWMNEFGPLGARGTFGAHACCGCCEF